MINLEIGLIITLLLLILVFRVHLSLDPGFTVTQIEQEVISMEEVVRTVQIHRPPPPPCPSIPRAVPDDEIVEEANFFDLSTDFDIQMALDIPAPSPSMPLLEEEEQIDEREIFTIVEEMPVLPGGVDAIYKYLRYHEIARRAGIEGRVIVQFIIDQEGYVVDPVVVRGIGGGCDEAALETVRQLRFSPGRQRGRPVRVRYSLPIIFRVAS
ncbi:MAG: energy transducer TonB [Cyclonatronaceae bacterium]